MDFGRKVLVTAFYKVANLGLGIIVSILLVRGLGAEDFGRYSLLITAVMTLATILTFGQHAANVYYISRKPLRASRFIANTVIYAITVSCLIILVFFYGGDTWLTQYYQGTLTVNDLQYIALLFPVTLLVTMTPSLLRGMYLITSFNIVHLFGIVLKIVFFWLMLWVLDRGLTGALETFFIVNSAMVILVLVIALRQGGRHFGFSGKLFCHSIGYGGKAYLGELAGLGRESIVILILGYHFPSSVIGLFVLAKNLAALVTTANQSISVPLLPRLARERGEEIVELTCRVTRVVTCSSAMAIICAALVGPLLIPVMYGEEYTQSIQIFLLLLPGIVGFAVTDVLTTYFMSSGYPMVRTNINIIASLAMFVILFIVLRGQGTIRAVAISVSVINLLTCAGASIYFRHLAGNISWRTMFIFNRSDFQYVASAFKRLFPVTH